MVLLVTLGCTATCKHCLYSCAPEKARYYLTKQEMVQALEDANKAGIRNVCFSGGEPFLYPDALFEAIAIAAHFGMYISLRTNGFWAITDEVVRRTLFYLTSVEGIVEIGLSYDRYHGEFVGLDCIKRILRGAEEFNLRVWLDWVGCQSKKQVWRVMGKYMPAVRCVVPATRVGRARWLSNRHFYGYEQEAIQFDCCYSFRCGDETPALTVYPRGYISLNSCCFAHPRLITKKPETENWIKQIAEDMEQDPALDFLYKHGVGGLIRQAKRQSPDQLRNYYTDDCEVCHQLLPVLFPKPDPNHVPNWLYDEEPGYCRTRSIHRGQLMTKQLIKAVEQSCPAFLSE